MVEGGRHDAACEWNQTVRAATLALGGVTAARTGPYRLSLEWDDGGRRETNPLTFLVVRAGWRAPVGLTHVTASDVG